MANKPLSAAQGVALKALIDGITVGKANASDLTAHTGNSTVHVTAEERTKWNKAVTDVGNLSEEIVDQYAKKSAIPKRCHSLPMTAGT